jgi:hypothetical protein
MRSGTNALPPETPDSSSSDFEYQYDTFMPMPSPKRRDRLAWPAW